MDENSSRLMMSLIVCSFLFHIILMKNQSFIVIGMSESGGSRGGVQAGRINGTMMDGMLPAKASASIGGAIDAEGLYGNRRPHVGIGMMAPAEA